MSTNSNCIIVRFVIIGPEKATLYLGVSVKFCPPFSLLFSDLGEIPHKKLEHNAAKFMSFVKTIAGKAIVFLGAQIKLHFRMRHKIIRKVL